MQKTALFQYSSNPYSQSVTATFCQHPFGMLIKERAYTSDTYRFGFNGMEKVDDVSGEGNNLDFGARIYNSRLGRWLSLDPHQSRYAALSPFNFSFNSPLLFNDPDGKDGRITIQKNEGGGGVITISTIVYITGLNVDAAKAARATEVAKDVFTAKTLTVDGQEWTVQFDIKFEAVDKKPDLKKGDNFLISKEPVGTELGHVEGKIVEYPTEVSYNKDAMTKTEIKRTIVHTGNEGAINSMDLKGKAKAALNYQTLMHETGHMLGLDDHYAKTIINGAEYKSGAESGWSESDIMVSGMELSAQHSNSFINMFKGVENGDYTYDFFVDVSKRNHSIKETTTQYDKSGFPAGVNDCITTTPTPTKVQ